MEGLIFYIVVVLLVAGLRYEAERVSNDPREIPAHVQKLERIQDERSQWWRVVEEFTVPDYRTVIENTTIIVNKYASMTVNDSNYKYHLTLNPGRRNLWRYFQKDGTFGAGLQFWKFIVLRAMDMATFGCATVAVDFVEDAMDWIGVVIVFCFSIFVDPFEGVWASFHDVVAAQKKLFGADHGPRLACLVC